MNGGALTFVDVRLPEVVRPWAQVTLTTGQLTILGHEARLGRRDLRASPRAGRREGGASRAAPAHAPSAGGSPRGGGEPRSTDQRPARAGASRPARPPGCARLRSSRCGRLRFVRLALRILSGPGGARAGRVHDDRRRGPRRPLGVKSSRRKPGLAGPAARGSAITFEHGKAGPTCDPVVPRRCRFRLRSAWSAATVASRSRPGSAPRCADGTALRARRGRRAPRHLRQMFSHPGSSFCSSSLVAVREERGREQESAGEAQRERSQSLSGRGPKLL